jgi:hypothetical protein
LHLFSLRRPAITDDRHRVNIDLRRARFSLSLQDLPRCTEMLIYPRLSDAAPPTDATLPKQESPRFAIRGLVALLTPIFSVVNPVDPSFLLSARINRKFQ